MYGLVISIGIIISVLYAETLVKKKGLNSEYFWKLSFWGLASGIIGARLYHVIHFWEFYSQNPLYIVAIWKGGLGIYGGIILASLVLWFLAKKDVLTWLDIFAQAAPLGQAIGRWGNFFNKELLPFSIYESFLDLTLFIILMLISRKNTMRETLFIIYLAGYALIRLILESIRTDHWVIAEFNITRLVSAGIIVLALFLIWKTKKSKTY